jgi:hypothetical protein
MPQVVSCCEEWWQSGSQVLCLCWCRCVQCDWQHSVLQDLRCVGEVCFKVWWPGWCDVCFVVNDCISGLHVLTGTPGRCMCCTVGAFRGQVCAYLVTWFSPFWHGRQR